jgi:hypothetical protein
VCWEAPLAARETLSEDLWKQWIRLICHTHQRVLNA